jgi:large conductance mechanosensitive channel
MFKGFKDFLFRGNVIDLSVAVVIGAAFTAVVTAFTDAFLKPLIQLLSPGGAQLAGTVKVDNVVFDYASFINQAITFFITAAVVYFLIVELLIEIRDLLQTQVTGGTAPASLVDDDVAAEPSPVEALAARLAVPTAAGPATAPVVPPTPAPAPVPVGSRAAYPQVAAETVPARPQRAAPNGHPAPPPRERPSRHSR